MTNLDRAITYCFHLLIGKLFSFYNSLTVVRISCNCFPKSSNWLLINLIESVRLNKVSFKPTKLFPVSSVDLIANNLHFAQHYFALLWALNFLKNASLKLTHEKYRNSLQFEHLFSSPTNISSIHKEHRLGACLNKIKIIF